MQLDISLGLDRELVQSGNAFHTTGNGSESRGLWIAMFGTMSVFSASQGGA